MRTKSHLILSFFNFYLWRLQICLQDGTQADYSITKNDSMVTVLRCNWKNCKQEKRGKLSSSSNSEYSFRDGWLKAEKLHKQIVDIYIKRVGERLTLRWSRLGKWMFTGRGIRSKYCFQSTSSRGDCYFRFTLVEKLCK